MAIIKTEAIVLKKQEFRETSLIVQFYTRDHGKISGILKGIRKDPRKFASTLEPFSHNEIVFYQKNHSTLHLVSQCDVRANFSNIRQNILKTAIAGLMMELVNSVMPVEDKNLEVFELAIASLKDLETTFNPEIVMMIFKFKILTISGFKPHFDSCVSCGQKISGESKFSLNKGGLLCLKCFAKDYKARAILKGTVASMLHIQRNHFLNNLSLGMHPEIKKELELVLNSFLSFHLEKDFKAERVLDQLKNDIKRLKIPMDA